MELMDHLRLLGAVFKKDHLVLTSGLHSDTYVNLRAMAPMVNTIKSVASDLRSLLPTYLQVVVGPETLGRTLAFSLAEEHRNVPYAIWCNIAGNAADKVAAWPPNMDFEGVLERGSKVVIVDDLLTTGSPLKPVITLLREYEVELLGAAVVIRRDPSVTAQTLGVPELWVLEDLDSSNTYTADECPMCQAGIPLRMRPGHGWKFAEDNPHHPSVIKAIA